MANKSTNDTVKTRVLIISDTHGAHLTEDAAHRNGKPAPLPPFKHPLPKADLLIHCGDLTMTGKISEYHATLDMLKAIDAPVKLVIAGNHDLTLDEEFLCTHPKDFRLYGRKSGSQWEERELWTSPSGRAVTEGVMFLDEGTHHVALPNGASLNVYASPYTPEFQDWGFPYEVDEDRFNVTGESLSDARNIVQQPVPSYSNENTPVDIMITHGPPFARLDRTNRGLDVGCPHLLKALMRCRPLLHCFGHIHEGWGAERVRWADQTELKMSERYSIEEWKEGAWRSCVDGEIEEIEFDVEETKQGHGAFVDVSGDSPRKLTRGRETLLVNGSIMNINYRPVNGPVVVDLDLQKTPK